MKNTEIAKIDPKEFGLEKDRASEITKGLATILTEKEILCEQYVKVIKLETTKENVPAFRELRLQIRDNRTKGIETWHKVNKEFFLRGGQFVDAIKRKEIEENNRMEEQLLKGEKHFELIEAERKAKVKIDREKALEKYEIETEHLQLGEMADDVWEKYFNGVKLEFEQRIAAEKKAEAERIEKEKAERAEQERIRKDNERLQKEAEAKEKQMQAERAEAEAKQKAIEEKARIEKAKLQRDIEKTQLAANLKAEREARERRKLEAELQKKKDAEIKAEADKKAAEAKEQRAPDKQKLIELAGRFSAPKLPEVKSNEAKEILKEVAEMCEQISIFIKEKY